MFRSGEHCALLSFPILKDDVSEGNETFNLILSNPSPGSTLNMRSNAVVTIVDIDDNGPRQFGAKI
jgi:hypothetical protein